MILWGLIFLFNFSAFADGDLSALKIATRLVEEGKCKNIVLPLSHTIDNGDDIVLFMIGQCSGHLHRETALKKLLADLSESPFFASAQKILFNLELQNATSLPASLRIYAKMISLDWNRPGFKGSPSRTAGMISEVGNQKLGELLNLCAAKFAHRLNPSCIPFFRYFSRRFPDETPEGEYLAAKLKPYRNQLFLGPRPPLTPVGGNSAIVLKKKSRPPEVDPIVLANDAFFSSHNGDQWISALKDLKDNAPSEDAYTDAQFWLTNAYASKNRLNPSETADYQNNLNALVSREAYSWTGILARDQLPSPERFFSLAAPLHQTASEVWDLFLNGMDPFDFILSRRIQFLSQTGVKHFAFADAAALKVKTDYPAELLRAAGLLAGETGNAGKASEFFSPLLSADHPYQFDAEVAHALFPMQYWDLIVPIAKRWGVDPMLILSLIKQESAFNPDAVSRSEAIGLGQLLPTTAFSMDPKLSRAELFLPKSNLELTARYLAQLNDQFKGNFSLMTAAYNAGPKRVDGWVRQGLAKDGFMAFVQRIPFLETRKYVASIFRNYRWNQFLFSQGTTTTPGPGPFWTEVAPK